MLKSVSIENYRGFFATQKIDFAVPDKIRPGSGLNLILGPNNTGKTSVVEALMLDQDKKFKESERHKDGNPVIKIENIAGNITTITNLNNGSPVTILGGPHGIKLELIPSRRLWAQEFSGKWEFSTLIAESARTDIRKGSMLNLGPVLSKILSDDQLKAKFDSCMKIVVPHFTDWTIDTNDNNSDYVKYKAGKNFHQANLLGDGIISLFRIVAHLVHDESSTFIIDEPELSLHPTAQKRLAFLISELSKSKQIIACTHSPYFVDWHDFVNGAKFIRLNKHADAQCEARMLDNAKDYGAFISRSLHEFQKPQLLDTVAKEILFYDKVLFTEGQEDVGLIRKWCEKSGKSIGAEMFGYGVGGECNMKLFLEMAKDLNLKKVAALYDSNSVSFSTDSSAYPDFLLKQLPTEDIRDKRNRCTNSCPYGKDREGTFSESGHLKQDRQNSFEKIILELERFFSQ